VAVKPRHLAFTQVGLDEEASRTLTVKVSEPEKVKITKVSVEDERFTVKLTDGSPGGDGTYEVAFAGSGETGRIATRVRIEFSGGAVPHLDVPLRGQVVGDLAYPQRLTFNKRDDKYDERDVRITSRTQQTVEILSAEDPDKNLAVEVTEAKGAAGVVHATVAAADGDAKGPIQGNLIIRTTDAREPEVKIPYGIYRSRKGLRRPPAVPMRRPGLRPLVQGQDPRKKPR